MPGPYVTDIPRIVVAVVRPAVHAVAQRLFVLTTERAGSAKYKPTVATFYETGLVTAVYEHLLMSPTLAHLEIRHEMPYRGAIGAPKRVDLWLRPPKGGYQHLIEAGDFTVKKVHADLKKATSLNPSGANWFLAFFRGEEAGTEPADLIAASLKRRNGLKAKVVKFNPALSVRFKVYRPDGTSDWFGAALLRAK